MTSESLTDAVSADPSALAVANESPEADAREADRTALRNRILGAFHGGIEPIDVPLTYRAGILLVALVMIVLPLIYVGLIGLVGYGVYYHATHHTALLGMGSGRARLMMLLVYLAPMIVGGILVLFMFKPLLSRPPRGREPRCVDRDDEPLLFDFVDRVCTAVGAPRPRRIDLDCQVNASASFRRGWLSFLGNDLVLTIGLPLVAGLNLRQFAGVLAHEFGHFSQGAAMRLTYIIRTISHWFTRVVYERDQWDERLVQWAKNTDVRVGWVFYLARIFVWATRKILWVLMVVGHAVSGYMLRQMEFDADRHEARLAGSDTFESTARRLVVLNVAHNGAMSDLGEFYREGRLVDELPGLVAFNAGRIPEEVLSKIDERIRDSKTGWFDTHPCDAERIASANREDAPGLFRLDDSATALFTDFGATSRQITRDFYRDVLGEAPRQSDLFPIAELRRRQDEELESFRALQRYFQGTYTSRRPFAPPALGGQPGDAPDNLLERLTNAREQMLSCLPGYRQHFASFKEVDARSFEIAQAAALLDASFRVKPDLFSRDLSTRDNLTLQGYAIGPEREQHERSLAGFEWHAATRLSCALQLLHNPQFGERIDGAEGLRGESMRLLGAHEVIHGQTASLRSVAEGRSALAILFQNLKGNEEKQPLIQTILARTGDLASLLGSIRQALDAAEYPFQHARGPITIGAFALAELPDPQNPGQVYSAAEALVESVFRLEARLIGRLCSIAEAVESAAGLDPLPEPAAESEAGDAGESAAAGTAAMTLE